MSKKILFSSIGLILASCSHCKVDSARQVVTKKAAETVSHSVASASDSIGYHGDPNSAENKKLLLKDFAPASMLHTKAHQVPKAKYYVIDTHSHINDAMGIQDHQDPKRVLEIMDHSNIKTVVILTGMWGEKLQKVIDEMVKPYPGRFIVFTQLDWSQVGDVDFTQKMIVQLRDSVKRGARGLKVLKDFGLTVKDKSGNLVKLDDPRFDPIWEECGRLGIPMAIHATDPEAFFHPIDAANERYEELIDNPDWGFSDTKKYPSKETILEARDRIFAKHPKTKFVALHLANWPENLDYVDAMLTKLPNVMVEFGARMAELGRQPRRAREFFLKFQDRIMFGSDNEMTEKLYEVHYRWLETADEYFDYWEAPSQGRWKVYGLNLPNAVLEKIYHKNAEKLFSGFVGEPKK